MALCAQTAQKWEILGHLIYPRHHHRAAYIGNSEILVFGGYINSKGILEGDPTSTSEIVNCKTGEVVLGPKMAQPRSVFTFERSSDSDLIVIGGGSDIVERFDIQTRSWTVIGKLTHMRWQHCSAWISDHEIIVIGGYNDKTAEIFDVNTGKSRPIRDFVDYANSLKSIIPNGRVPTFWGYRESGPGSSRSSVSHFYDVVSNSWKEDIDLLVAVAWPFTLTLSNGHSFITGGVYSESPFNCTTATFDISPNGKVALGPKSFLGRQHHGAIEWLPNSILVVGGIGDGVSWLKSTEFNDLNSNKTYEGPDMNAIHAFTQLVSVPTAIGNTAVVISGLARSENTPLIEILKPDCRQEVIGMVQYISTRGSAHATDSTIVLTDTALYQAGAAWLRGRVDVTNPFTMNFGFTLDHGNDHDQPDGGPAGADGVAFVIQNESESPLGESGRGIGYDNMFGGLAVEFDAYQNGAFADPSGSHVAVQTNDGSRLRASHVAPYLKGITYDGIPNFVANGTHYHARVEYDGSVLTVYVGENETLNKPCLTIPINIAEEVGTSSDGRAWLGFTSSTGFSSQYHTLDYASLSSCNPVITSVPVQQPSHEAILRVQPNPATLTSTVILPKHASGTFLIYDVTGAVHTSLYVVDQDTITLPVSDLAPGAYAVRFIPESGSPLQSMLFVGR